MKDLGMFVMVRLLEDTPAALSLGKLCEEKEYSYARREGQTPNLFKTGKFAPCTCDNFVLVVVLGRSSEAHLTSSAEDSAESIKELASAGQDTT